MRQYRHPLPNEAIVGARYSYDGGMQTDVPAIRVGEEVRAAVDGRRPVLALESTILSHGLPRPRNLEGASRPRHSVREAGVVPATIGVIDGVAVVGLSAAEIERLCTADGVVKVSVRDLPIAGRSDSTAARPSRPRHGSRIGRASAVMSTGGLGGVHRGASETFDESADLDDARARPRSRS